MVTEILQAVLGATVFGVPVTAATVGVYLCGVSALYIVTMRHLRKGTALRVRAVDTA